MALFAALFFAATKGLHFPSNIAAALALAFSIMGSIGIPEQVLVYLTATYGTILSAALILLPGVALAWFTFTALKQFPTRWVAWGFALASFFYRQVYVWLMRIHMDGNLRFTEKTPRNCFIIPFAQ